MLISCPTSLGYKHATAEQLKLVNRKQKATKQNKKKTKKKKENSTVNQTKKKKERRNQPKALREGLNITSLSER